MNNPLVQVDPGLFIWTIITFLVLVALLAKFAWRPLLEALEKRQQTIAGAVEDAKRAREELERVTQDAARLLAEARRESDGLINRARSDADRLRDELRTKAMAESAAILRNTEQQVQRETARALAQIRAEAVDISVAMASKILQRAISPADHDRLLDDVVKQIDRSSH